MNIQDYYKYSQFSALAYVDWRDISKTDFQEAISDANAAERIPGNTIDSTVNTLGEKIFSPVTNGGQGWRVADYHPNDPSGFKASFFTNDTTGEKVLAICGTEPNGNFKEDLIAADLQEIGDLGMAIHQAVDLYNYIQQLTAPAGVPVAQFAIKETYDIPPDDDYVMVNFVPPVYYSLEIVSGAEGLGLLDPADNVTITGHSLGGHLAALGSRLFPDLFDVAVTYNAPGFDPAIGVSPFKLEPTLGMKLTDEFINTLFAPILDTPPANKYGNITVLVSEDSVPGDDGDGVTSTLITGAQPAVQMEVTTEQNSHMIEPFMDSLAVQALLDKIHSSGNLSLMETSNIIKAASADAGKSEEIILDKLSELLLGISSDLAKNPNDVTNGFDAWIGAGDFTKRSLIHERIIQLEDKITELKDAGTNLNIVQTHIIAGHVFQDNDDGLAYRYALVHLNPFAITGDAYIYSDHNKTHELDYYNPTTEEGKLGALTIQYLKDRAQMLDWLIKYNETDTDYADELASEHVGNFVGNYHYTDYSQKDIFGKPMCLTVDGEGFAVPYTQIKFGSEGVDVIEGVDPDFFGRGDGEDHLYGMAGNDTLEGKGGDDYIEGGLGDDTLTGGKDNDTLLGGAGKDKFIFSSGDGIDEIIDKDHTGDEIIIDGINLKDLVFACVSDGGDSYIDKNHNESEGNSDITITRDGSSLVVTSKINGVTDFIRIKHFVDGDFGITLNDYTEEEYEIDVKEYVFDDYHGVYNPINNFIDNTHPTYQYRQFDLLANKDYDYLPGGPCLYYWMAGMSMELHAAVMRHPFHGNGRPWVDGDDADDVIYGARGLVKKDGVNSKHHNDHIRGKGGDDIIYGDYEAFPQYDGVTVIDEYMNGNDFITGGHGSDTIYGNGGDDIIFGLDEFRTSRYTWWTYDDPYSLGIVWNVDMTTWSNFYYHTVLTHDVNDMENEGDQDTIFGGDGNDQIYAGSYDDFLFGEDGDDSILAGAGSDLIDGGIGEDTIYGDSYARFNNLNIVPEPDWASIDDGHITNAMIYWENGKYITPDYINEIKPGLSYNDFISAGDGDDTVFGEIGDDTIFGGKGSDILVGDRGGEYFGKAEELKDELNGNDVIFGGEGDDVLCGNGGNDILDGGTDNDQLYGGAGADTFVFRDGDGLDVIYDGDADDTVIIQSTNNVSASINADNSQLILSYGPSDAVYINGGTGTQIDKFDLGNGDILSKAELLNMALNDDVDIQLDEAGEVSGGSGNDRLKGSAGDDLLYGLNGNDHLEGGNGIDMLDGGKGADNLYGGEGDDQYLFHKGDGIDVIRDEEGANLIQFLDVELNDITTSSIIDDMGDTYLVIKYSQTDAVHVLNGLSYKENVYELSDGLFSIDELISYTWDEINHAPVVDLPLPDLSTAEDSLFAFQIPEGSFVDADSGDTLSLSVDMADGSPLPDWLVFDAVTNTFSGTPDNYDVGTVEVRVTATDGYGATVSDIFMLEITNVNDAPELMRALADVEAVEGDSLSYIIPADTFRDIDQGDSLTYSATLANGESLPGWLSFDPVSLTLFSELPMDAAGEYDISVHATDQSGVSVSDTFHLSVANLVQDPTWWNRYHGTFFNDLIVGSDKSEWLYGYDGNDQLIAHGGNDILNGGAGNDILIGGKGMDLLRGGVGDDLLIGDDDCGQHQEDSSRKYHGILGLFNWHSHDWPSNSNDTLLGGDGNDRLHGGTGGDALYGGDGDDVLDGGAGSDILNGGEGNDTYRFSRNDGYDIINEYDADLNDLDTLHLDGISYKDLMFSKQRNDLIVDIADSNDRVCVKNWYRGESYQLDAIVAEDLILQNDLVSQLGNAMAQFDVPNGVGGVIPQELKEQLPPLIAASL